MKFMHFHRNALPIVLAGVFLGFSSLVAQAEDSSLQKLNQDIQKLYRESRKSLPMVQIPMPNWLRDWQANRNQPRFPEQLNPELRRELETLTARSNEGFQRATQEQINPFRPPATQPAVVNIQGIIIDDKFDVLVPVYLDPEASNDLPILVRIDGQRCQAKYIGADKQTHLTLLQLDKPLGSPAKIGDSQIDDGELVVMHAPDGSAPRLMVWTGGKGTQGMIIKVNGEATGFCRAGEFVPFSAVMPIAKQLAATGVVRRAVLGVKISTVEKDDPARHLNGALGEIPAIRVDGIIVNSPAHRAGILPGDLILEFAGQSVGEVATFSMQVATREGKTDLVVLRGTERRTLAIELERK